MGGGGEEGLPDCFIAPTFFTLKTHNNNQGAQQNLRISTKPSHHICGSNNKFLTRGNPKFDNMANNGIKIRLQIRIRI